MEPDEIIARICSFLAVIGIPYDERTVTGSTFLPGLDIQRGRVTFDRSRLLYPGDLLHEAGHIALTKPSLRQNLSQEALAAQDPSQSEEVGVILWTHLAAREIGIPVESVFHAAGYKDQSKWLMDQFESGNYIGLPLLIWMGVAKAGTDGGPPVVTSWLRVSGE